MAQGFEFGADFEVVVNLAVEDDDRIAIFREDRLVSSGEIDNFEPGRAETAACRAIDALLIWATMTQRVSCPRDALWTRIPTFRCESDYAAQVLSASWGGAYNLEQAGNSLVKLSTERPWHP